MTLIRSSRWFCLSIVAMLSTRCLAQESTLPWRAGVAKVDVTPTEPVRMAGYGSRDHPSEGIDTPLSVRCLALKSNDDDSPPSLLISVDTIGLPGSMTRTLAEQIASEHHIPRDKVVFCSTHTHCGPDLVSELSNIFATELTAVETAAGERYRAQLHQGIMKSVELALQDLAPATIGYAVGKCEFAANRRLLKDGRWVGFGVQPDGPVDHALPILRIVGVDGKPRAIVFNYACHCTTLGGQHYRINAEWAGYACDRIEAANPDAVALCTIGCGADANPNPRGSLDATKLHGQTLATEVARVMQGEMRSIDAPLSTKFDYAGLSFDLPTTEELTQRVESARDPQSKRHAQQLLEVYQREGRLPATYPVPIGAWQFGDQLTMVFIGGEVVVDYALRLKTSLDNPDLWVTAYANDVLGYIASERMRSEGGYEYDRSGVYYGLPGPWAAGTEDFLISRIEKLLQSQGRSEPLPADKALKSFRLSDDLQIELVASEPLVQDPINLAFAADGRLWVVEMGDYPQGEHLGRVKVLSDSDGDGHYETASVFLSGLPFPTGVHPWRDGVIISAAPDILFARDTNGDDRADEVKKLYSGFRLANPQHRISGFSYGLDHWLHCSAGDNLSEITSELTGETLNASGHDLKISPDDGRIAKVSGRTQYIRSRNDWGQWFGNDNSHPMFHYAIDSSYLSRNSAVTYSGNTQQLFDPPVAPPVFPRTAATERFNDLFAANRFTSACSAIVFRSPAFGVAQHDVAFICEPVHNLVHRAILEPDGASFRAVRAPQETESEFLASTDPWFRPTRAVSGPDGALWIVDMYRETIEHPEWIPQAWQQQLNLRAGEDRGRIYRIIPPTATDHSWKSINGATTSELVDMLRSPHGTLRDMAQRLILHRQDPSAVPQLKRLANDDQLPAARVSALSILSILDKLDHDTLLAALQSRHAGVLLVAVRLSEPRIDDDPQFLARLRPLAQHEHRGVVLQVALALGASVDPTAGEILATIATEPQIDTWVARAVCTSASKHSSILTTRLIDQFADASGDNRAVVIDLLSKVVATAQANRTDVFDTFATTLSNRSGDLQSQLLLASTLLSSIPDDRRRDRPIRELLEPIYDQAVTLIQDLDADVESRCHAVSLLGLGISSPDREQPWLVNLIQPATPPSLQIRAIDHLTRSNDTSADTALIETWPSMTKTIRDHCIGCMLSRRNWSESLLTALETGQIAVNDLTAAARQQLSQSGSRSFKVRAARLLRVSGSAEKQALVRSYLGRFGGERDANQGEALFKKHCAVCHVPDTQGRAIGASLENLTDRSDRYLVEAILDPNRAVDPQYKHYLVRTIDDRILAGAIEEEVGSSLTLAHADGKRTTINRREIGEIKNLGISLMPEGFEEQISPTQLQDLIYYLQMIQDHARPQ